MNILIENQTSPSPQPSVEPSAPEAHPAASVHRAHSKIGRLPKAVRDKLNFLLRDGVAYDFLLRDGVAYDEIPPRLGDEALHITARNLSNWHASPHYQHWLLQQEWIEDLRSKQEPAFDLLHDFDAAKFNEGALELAVTRLFLAFRQPETTDLNHFLGGNARTFASLVQALARAARETTNIEKYRAACATAREALKPMKDVHRKLTQEETLAIVRKVDEVLGFCSPSDPYPEKPAAPGPRVRAEAASQFEVQGSHSKAQSSPSAPTALASASSTCPSAASQFEVQGSQFKVQSSGSSVPVVGHKLPNPPSPPESNPPDFNQADDSRPIANPATPLKSEISNPKPQDSQEPSYPTTTEPQVPAAPIENQKPEIQNPNPAATSSPDTRPPSLSEEHCLECGVLLPKLLPNGGRPRQHCDKCCFELPPPFCCVQPSIEQCRACRANLPRLLPDGRRPETHCHHCGAYIIDPVPIPQASSNAPPDTPKLQAA